MRERNKPDFSEDEREQIASLAKELAVLGEDAIWDVVKNKGNLCIASIQILDFAIPNQQAVELGEMLKHDVAVMTEIIRQARSIRQMMGLDEIYNMLAERGLLDKFLSDSNV